MPRSRPTSNPISYYKWTRQFYVTRSGRRIYLGPDKEEALKRYTASGLGVALILQEPASPVEITIKELANPLFSLTAETAEVAEKVIVIFHYRTVGYISTSLTVCLY
jgi:hypothetical protein